MRSSRQRGRRRVIATAAGASLALHAGGIIFILTRPSPAPPEEDPSLQVVLVPMSAITPDARPVKARYAHRRVVSAPHAPSRPATADEEAPEAGQGAPAPIDVAGGQLPRLRLHKDCLTTPRDQLSDADRERCAHTLAAAQPSTIISGSRAKDEQFKAAADRKAAIAVYHATINGPYPGMRCMFRGVCEH